ncbi:MAG: cation transporter [Chlamydiae bacterium CG10_big_fil_rev_8_21_14_0_10_42_34]|nr:MAG: cation transporter [Chlamydiae bacterium CG10_big_fil_rev_8_21_14_0_10_42_34]
MIEERPFHSTSIDQTFKSLETSLHGLSAEEVAKRKIQYGKNVIAEEKVSKIKLFVRQFNNVLIYILFAASLISLSIGEWTDFFVINFIILFNGLIGFWQEIKAENSIAALKKLTESKNNVVRDGQLGLISSSELVPGDLIVFHEGEIVTSDVRLVDGRGLMVDESSLTGESMPVMKDHTATVAESALAYEMSNMLLAGTVIVRGTGKGIVVKTGNQTYFAKIAEKSKEASPQTPLIRALSFFAKRYVVLLIILFTFVGIIGFFQGRSVLDLSYVLLVSLVSAVPEGLPIVMTLVMVVGAVLLSKKQALVRYLPSVETLGSATVIASDKTGTITEGKLIVKEHYGDDVEKLKLIAALCNDSDRGTGDPLEVALAGWVTDYDQLRLQFPRKWTYAFDTRQLLMATANKTDSAEQLFVKGAYESLRKRASNQQNLEKLDAEFDLLVSRGLRVLAFGIGPFASEDPDLWKLQIVGLVGFFDPAKKGVKEAVTSAKKAGIRVLMITGDHPMTARAVAHEVGIWNEGDLVLSGKELETLSDENLLEACKKTTVFARIIPEHKYRIVKLLQGVGDIVAVTGDGVNDIPALKAADIGISMGGGTEAAKSASKMVITDNNLRIITEAIRNARVISDNIRKVIYYLISTSTQEIILISLSIFGSLPLPLSAIQILWINIVTDGVLDKTFALIKEEGDVMSRKPMKPERQFFNMSQIGRILYFGLIMGVLTFFLYVYLLDIYSFEVVSTIIFTSVVVSQWANGVQAQKELEPFFKNIRSSFTINPLILVGFAVGVSLQCIAIYLLPRIFHTVPLTIEQWIFPAICFLIAFFAVELRKWASHWLMVLKNKP